MDSYKSELHTINANISIVYGKLSNPETFRAQIEANLDKLPDEAKEHLKQVTFEPDGINIESPIGAVKLQITETVEPEKIVFSTPTSPVPFGLTINLTDLEGAATQLLSEVNIDLPAMLRPMVGGKLNDLAKMFGEMLAKLPYDHI